MNRKLMEAITRSPQDISKDEILSTIMECEPQAEELMGFLSDGDTLRVVALAASFIIRDNYKAAKDTTLEGTWQRLIGATENNKSLDELVNNPAIANFVQTILLIAIALIEGGER